LFGGSNFDGPVNTRLFILLNGSVPFGHGSIGHHQPQRPVPRSFPLFKRCEWLFVSKRRPPLLNHQSKNLLNYRWWTT